MHKGLIYVYKTIMHHKTFIQTNIIRQYIGDKVFFCLLLFCLLNILFFIANAVIMALEVEKKAISLGHCLP